MQIIKTTDHLILKNIVSCGYISNLSAIKIKDFGIFQSEWLNGSARAFRVNITPYASLTVK